MRQHPIGTGSFKFGEFQPNGYIKLAKNPDYWKPGQPYLDGIEYTIMREIASRNLASFATKFDVTSPYSVAMPRLKDFKGQVPQAISEITATNVSRTMLINANTPAFDKREPRQAMALSLDRQVFIDMLAGGQAGHRRHHAVSA